MFFKKWKKINSVCVICFFIYFAANNRVATQPGKPGEPGKVREFDI